MGSSFGDTLSMKKEDYSAQWEVWGVALVVSVAVSSGLAFKGLSGENLADAVKDMGSVIIPILSAFVAAKLVTGQMDPSERIARAGEASLVALREKHRDILSGPKGNRENYDEDNPGGADKYLFVQRDGKGRKAQLIRVSPLREGIVEIRVPKTTLLVLGIGNEDGLEAAQKEALAQVRDAVQASIQRNVGDSLCEILPHKHPDIAVVVDFDESKLGPKKFGAAVMACGEAAVEALISRRR